MFQYYGVLFKHKYIKVYFFLKAYFPCNYIILFLRENNVLKLIKLKDFLKMLVS